jgi:hypothetical protein
MVVLKKLNNQIKIMNKIKLRLSSLIIGTALLGLSALLPVSCGTTNTNTYRAVSVSQVSVQTALELWNKAIPVIHPSLDLQTKVRVMFDRWKASMILVCDAGAAYSAGIGTANEVNLANALQYAISNSNQTKGDLINLLVEAGVKIQ